jgi:hypothetical protein
VRSDIENTSSMLALSAKLLNDEIVSNIACFRTSGENVRASESGSW